ncbi:hypothetical protein RIF29_25146 [Crotalaria pallida]|uniref:Cation/H+ exchanger domain-containing protein n=1 Tax=Crotalaria pallida TaxID=3830 RepID=A0AAN9HZ15_CROPI
MHYGQMAISLYRCWRLDIDKYMLAEGLGLSGHEALFIFKFVTKFSKICLCIFQLISSLAETFVFIYMGFDIAMEQHSWSRVGFIFFSIIFIVIARAANVFSWLRGAMAFALALQSVHDLPEGHGKTILTATTTIVVLTVLESDLYLL